MMTFSQNTTIPYGLPIADEHYSSAITPYKYSGKEFDTMNGLNLYDFEARFYDPALCQFPEADPLAEYYYSLSPNLYCGGNPILFIDPNGEAKMYLFDKLGNFLGSEEYSGEEDVIYIVEKNNGTYVICLDRDGRFMQFFVGSGDFEILKESRGYGGYGVYSVRGDELARKVFEFFSHYVSGYCDVEYGLVLTGSTRFIDNRNTTNYVFTSHDMNMIDMSKIYNNYLKGVYIRSFIHTHPNEMSVSDSDKKFASHLKIDQYRIYNTITNLYIYHLPTQTYIPYMQYFYR